MSPTHEDSPAGDETFEEYSARQKDMFAADKVYESTKDRPASGTYTRKLDQPEAPAAAERVPGTGKTIAELINAAMAEEPDLIVSGNFDDYLAQMLASKALQPVEYTVLDRLNVLVRQVAGQPEMVFVVTSAIADEMLRLGVRGPALDRVQEAVRAVRQTIGSDADFAWKKLSRMERFRNRNREAEWKLERTDAFLAEGRRRVAAILADR